MSNTADSPAGGGFFGNVGNLLGPIGSIAGGLFGMFGQNRRMRQQMQHQKNLMGLQFQNQQALNRQGHELQLEMWNKTNYPAQMAMLKEAGLNPALLYGMSGGGGTTAGSQTGGSAAGGQAGMLDIGSALAAAKLGAEIENIKAQTKLTENKGMTEEQNLILAKAETDIKVQNLDNMKAIYENLKKEGQRQGLENEFLKETLKDRIAQVGIENLFKEQGIKESKARITEMVDRIKEMVRSNDIKEFEAKLKEKYPSLFNVAGNVMAGAVKGLFSLFGIDEVNPPSPIKD